MTKRLKRAVPSRISAIIFMAFVIVWATGGGWPEFALGAPPRKEAARPRSRPTVKSDATSAPFYSIQVASLTIKANAESLFKTLTRLGYEAYLESPTSNSGPEYRLKVGRYQELSDMNQTMTRLRKDGFNPVIAQYKEQSWPVDTMPEAKPFEAAVAGHTGSAAVSPPVTSTSSAREISAKLLPPSADKIAESAHDAATATADAEVKGEEAPSETPPALSGDSWLGDGLKVLQSLGALAFVIALIFGGFFLVKRLNPERVGRRARDRMLRALDSMALGEKKSIMLVEVSGDKYLLASTPNDVCLLAKIEPNGIPLRSLAAEPPAVNQDFNTLLSQKKAELAKAGVAASAGAGQFNARSR